MRRLYIYVATSCTAILCIHTHTYCLYNMWVYISISIYIDTHTHTQTHILYKHIHVFMNCHVTRACAYLCIYTCAHLYMCVFLCICTYKAIQRYICQSTIYWAVSCRIATLSRWKPFCSQCLPLFKDVVVAPAGDKLFSFPNERLYRKIFFNFHQLSLFSTSLSKLVNPVEFKVQRVLSFCVTPEKSIAKTNCWLWPARRSSSEWRRAREKTFK